MATAVKRPPEGRLPYRFGRRCERVVGDLITYHLVDSDSLILEAIAEEMCI